jgi:hypothetical protein
MTAARQRVCGGAPRPSGRAAVNCPIRFYLMRRSAHIWTLPAHWPSLVLVSKRIYISRNRNEWLSANESPRELRTEHRTSYLTFFDRHQHERASCNYGDLAQSAYLRSHHARPLPPRASGSAMRPLHLAPLPRHGTPQCNLMAQP